MKTITDKEFETVMKAHKNAKHALMDILRYPSMDDIGDLNIIRLGLNEIEKILTSMKDEE